MSVVRDLESRFARACDVLCGELAGDEALSLEFSGEQSTFLRFNHAQVRQIGEVTSARIDFRYCRNGRTLSSMFEATGDADIDAGRAATALGAARREAALLPEDPYQTLPVATGESREEFGGSLPAADRLVEEVLAPGAELTALGADFVGLHAQGPVCRGAANHLGARHWFATETFAVDYSAWLANGKAIKASYGGRHWDGEAYRRGVAAEAPRLEALGRAEKRLEPGEYRVWIGPQALAEFMAFFSWHGLSERGLREGESAWLALREGRRHLSPQFQLTQDFTLGVEPRFNELGEVAPERLVLIEDGRLANTLVSARTALQYGTAGNAAPEWEGLRSPAVGEGALDEERALELLGTGLFVANLHYLNWSDFDSARVTGMTRFACFWVEGGEIVAPIKDMRFDESLYHLWGDKLVGASRQRSLVVETGSYYRRALSGALLPAMLVNGFTFTL
jgi:predicted Zn-dependent protease